MDKKAQEQWPRSTVAPMSLPQGGFPQDQLMQDKNAGFVSWMGKLCMLLQVENRLLLH